jgi:lipoyl(octanoyl) transferase
MQKPAIDVRWLGRIEYREAWELQDRLAKQRLADSIPDTLLLLEHPPTLTLGRGADAANILAGADRLARMGVAVVETNRGGDVTYHGPGQLVGYPILNLSRPPHRPDLHLYLRNLEEVLIRTLAAFGVESGRFPGYTGVWTGMGSPQARKVAAIGIRTSRWITQHGFALNVCTDLSHFDLIVPCGIRDYDVTSLQLLLEREIAVAEPIAPLVESFESVFKLQNSSAIADLKR